MYINPFQSTEETQVKGVLFSNDEIVEHTLENGKIREINFQASIS